ncbi:DUF2061 domain-containing protein [Paracrocinitomix mangrovi]|uniref:DUF2061 domain-containing protein n=1 Tax=Paracrocinitomix mangrovi TaxID=2862509 RepID=UPI001C8E77FE|nr:DUF2061 domain-containing protein [Paracrocinitomix mangrovi]UKN01767.1 DUF2061 domain-containing protein [Paracrocinitomix mangrovi]
MFIDHLIHKRGIRRGDSTVKTILKTVSWRVVGTVDTMVIAFFLTGEVTIAVSIGSVEVFTKMILYYIHERVWNKFI